MRKPPTSKQTPNSHRLITTVRRLKKLTVRHQNLTKLLVAAQDKVYEEIIDGTTNDEALDFALACSNGAWDDEVVETYRGLTETVRRDAGKTFFIVQEANVHSLDGELIIRNIYHGVFRAGQVEFDKHKLRLFIPVVNPYIAFCETFYDDEIMAAWKAVRAEQLPCGPLETLRLLTGEAVENQSGAMEVKVGEASNMYPYIDPRRDGEELLQQHDITPKLIRFLQEKLSRAIGNDRPLSGTIDPDTLL